MNWGAVNEQAVTFNHERVGRIAPERIAALWGPITSEVVSSQNSGGEHVLRTPSPRSCIHTGHRLEGVKRGSASYKHCYFFGRAWPILESALKSKEPGIAVNVVQLSRQGQTSV